MCNNKPLDTTSRTTIAQLAAKLLEFEPDCEVVLSSAELPKGLTRLCIATPEGGRCELGRYCRLVDEDPAPERSSFAKHICNVCGLTVRDWVPPLLSISTPQVESG